MNLDIIHQIMKKEIFIFQKFSSELGFKIFLSKDA